jgi:hypothetical protein
MRWCLCTPRSAEHILPITLITSGTAVPPYTRRRSLQMYLDGVMVRAWRCTWRPRDSVNSQTHLEAVIEGVWRCTWRQRLSQAIIEHVGRYAWRQWSNKIGGVLRRVWSGSDWSDGSQSGVVNMEVVNMEAVDREACTMEAESLFIG